MPASVYVGSSSPSSLPCYPSRFRRQKTSLHHESVALGLPGDLLRGHLGPCCPSTRYCLGPYLFSPDFPSLIHPSMHPHLPIPSTRSLSLSPPFNSLTAALPPDMQKLLASMQLSGAAVVLLVPPPQSTALDFFAGTPDSPGNVERRRWLPMMA